MAEGLYRPLKTSGRPVRTVTLLPALNEDSGIECQLVSTDLDDSPKYVALSYVWGHDSVKSHISVNGESFLATANLFQALWHLRARFCHVDPLVIWIDSLCIDQSNAEERSRQVQMMGEIYENATIVVAWVGEEAESSKMALGMIHALGTGVVSSKDIKSWSSMPEIMTPGAWDALNTLFQRSYWSRVWTLQEFVLGRDVLFMCGTETIEGSILKRAYWSWSEDLSHGQERVWQHFSGESAWKIIYNSWSNMRQYLVWRQQYHGNAQSPTLLEMLVYSQNLRATDARDKIYGLLGLSDHDITADYSKSTAEVYTDFARDELRKLHGAALTLAGSGILQDDHRSCILPSWATDWHGLASSQIKPNFFHNRLRYNTAYSPKTDKPTFRVSDASASLWTQGIRCQPLTEVLPPGFDDDLSPFWNRWLGPQIDKTYPTGLPMLQALFRTLLLDVDRDAEVRLKDSGSRFFDLAAGFFAYLGRQATIQAGSGWEPSDRFDHEVAFMQWLELCLPKEDPDAVSDRKPQASLFLQDFFLGSGAPTVDNPWPKDRSICAEKSLIFDYTEQTMFNTMQRAFFFTRDGYFGLGPRGASVGDIACAFIGCKSLFLLRKIAEEDKGEGENDKYCHYDYVGPCFILGFMDGEALHGVDEGKLAVEEFEIC